MFKFISFFSLVRKFKSFANRETRLPRIYTHPEIFKIKMTDKIWSDVESVIERYLRFAQNVNTEAEVKSEPVAEYSTL